MPAGTANLPMTAGAIRRESAPAAMERRSRMLRLLAFLVLLLSTGPVLAQDAVLVALRCPDPPPSVDGRLGE